MTVPRSARRTTMPGSAAPSRLHGPVLVPALVLAFGLGACDDRPLTAPEVDRLRAEPSAAIEPAPTSASEDLSRLSTVCRVLSRHLEDVRREVESGQNTTAVLLSTAEDLEKALQHTCG